MARIIFQGILLQVIFYDRDDEFPARVTLLFDQNATCFLEFEFLAVLAQPWVDVVLSGAANIEHLAETKETCWKIRIGLQWNS